jgi:hypothetical protein
MPSTIEDRDSILQLMYRYNHAIDGGDADGWAATFTDDGALDAAGHVIAGRDELVSFAKGVHGMRHVVVNPVVEVDGDTASVAAYIVVYRGLTPTTIGTYADEVVRTPGGWRFQRRVFRPDASDNAAADTLRALSEQ